MTTDEMRISDWSSDVCSSDLAGRGYIPDGSWRDSWLCSVGGVAPTDVQRDAGPGADAGAGSTRGLDGHGNSSAHRRPGLPMAGGLERGVGAPVTGRKRREHRTSGV